MVFRFPDTSLDLHQAGGGLGDKVEYIDKKLTINGQAMPQAPDGDYLQNGCFSFHREARPESTTRSS
jgi:hypothetical protein